MTSHVHSVYPLTRRSFLAGSAALFGASALQGLDVHTLPVKNTGFPRGKVRNLIAKQCSPEALKQHLIPLEKYKPFPKAGDGEWGTLRPETRTAFVSDGEKFLGHTFEALSATLFLSYARVGDPIELRAGAGMPNLAALLGVDFG